MRKSKRINTFLLLAIILLSFVISGCTPQQQAEQSGTEFAVLVLDKSYIEGCDVVFFTESLYAAAHPTIYGERIAALFNEFFNGIEFTDDSTRVEDVRNSTKTAFPCHLNFSCSDGTNPLTIMVYDDGTLGMLLGDHEYVSQESCVVDLELLKEWLK